MIRQVFSASIHDDSDTPRPVLQKHSSPMVNMSETSRLQQQQQQIAVTSSSPMKSQSFHDFPLSDIRWDMDHINQFSKASQSRISLCEASPSQRNLGIEEVNKALGSDFELRSEKKRKKKEEKRKKKEEKKQKKKKKRDQAGVFDSTTDPSDTNSTPPPDCRPRVIRFTRINGGDTGDSDSTADRSDTNSTPPDCKPRLVIRIVRNNGEETAKIATAVSASATDFTTTISASAIDKATTVSVLATDNPTTVSAAATDFTTTNSAVAIDNATTVSVLATDKATTVSAAATDIATTVSALETDIAALQVTEDSAVPAKKKKRNRAVDPSDTNSTPPDCRPRLVIRRSGEETAKIVTSVSASPIAIATTVSASATNISTTASASATNIVTRVSALATNNATTVSALATDIATRISAETTDIATVQVTEDLASPAIAAVDERISNGAAQKADEIGPRTWNLRPRNRSIAHDDDSLQKNKPQGTIRTESLRSEKTPRLWISLSKKEIEEDIYALTGSKPSRRPEKRPKNVQKHLDGLFPGLWIGNVSLDTYKV